jgi:methionine aminotransferase
MQKYPYPLRTKLPNIGTSIFAVMSQLANEHKAINLSQGFPDFEISSSLIELVNKYMKKGYNQYAPMPGVQVLRKNISEKYKNAYGIAYDPEDEINITAGATQAINTVISAFIKEGDEVIVFDPAYDSYVPSIKLNGGIVRYAKLRTPDYHAEWNDVKKLMNSNTRMIIINSPHNPTGSVFSEADLKALDKLTRNTEVIVLSDEVYEHLIFDGKTHESVCKYPELAKRSFMIGSFGKTFHATGWKVGYCLAPANLMAEFRRSHQFVVYAVNTPIQYAIAEYLENEENYNNLASFYQDKRDLFLDLIKTSRFKEIPSYGTYFQVLNYENISNENEVDFAQHLTKEFGVASIPLSVFYNDKQDNKTLRFCFAKQEKTLKKAAEILCRI